MYLTNVLIFGLVIALSMMMAVARSLARSLPHCYQGFAAKSREFS